MSNGTPRTYECELIWKRVFVHIINDHVMGLSGLPRAERSFWLRMGSRFNDRCPYKET
jgi:hypothetical protein